MFQFALLLAFGWLIWAWWRADRAAGLAQLSPRQLADAYGRDRDGGLRDLGNDAEAKSNADSKHAFGDGAHLRL